VCLLYAGKYGNQLELFVTSVW